MDILHLFQFDLSLHERKVSFVPFKNYPREDLHLIEEDDISDSPI